VEEIIDSISDGVIKMEEKEGITSQNLSMEPVREFFRWDR